MPLNSGRLEPRGLRGRSMDISQQRCSVSPPALAGQDALFVEVLIAHLFMEQLFPNGDGVHQGSNRLLSWWDTFGYASPEY
jgi:hypothetical protein